MAENFDPFQNFPQQPDVVPRNLPFEMGHLVAEESDGVPEEEEIIRNPNFVDEPEDATSTRFTWWHDPAIRRNIKIVVASSLTVITGVGLFITSALTRGAARVVFAFLGSAVLVTGSTVLMKSGSNLLFQFKGTPRNDDLLLQREQTEQNALLDSVDL